MASKERKINPHALSLQRVSLGPELETRSIKPKKLSIHHVLDGISGLVVITLRLPVNVCRDSDGSFIASFANYSTSTQGFRSLNINQRWVGMLDMDVQLEDRAAVDMALYEIGCKAVYLDQDLYQMGIDLFAKTVRFTQRLWQLFHYSVGKLEGSGEGICEKNLQEWNAYKAVNMEYARNALEIYQEGNLIWVQDYSLMMVPGFLRMQKPEASIGYFQHIPFPSNEFYSIFPYRNDLLKAVLCASLIGFNGYDYMRHFLEACTYLLGLVVNSYGIDALPKGGCFVRVGTYPISVNHTVFENLHENTEYVDIVNELLENYKGKQVILGVDQLDFPKGIMHKLLAFEKFLKDNPEYRSKVVLVQILGEAQKKAQVSEENKRLLSNINEYIAKINGQYGSFGCTPIQHFCQYMEYYRINALMRVADIMLITSLRDGMNLVALEYVANQTGRHGVLMLSEFAGAAQSLGAGAVIINPWNVRETSKAIKLSIEMPPHERVRRHEIMHNFLKAHTATNFVNRFIRDLKSASTEPNTFGTIPSLLPYSEVLRSYQDTKKRFITLGVLDVLADPKRNIDVMQFKSSIYVSFTVKQNLKKIASDSRNIVLLWGSLDCKTMDRIFQGLPVWLAAENGFYYKYGMDTNWQKLNDNSDMSWRPAVLNMLNQFKMRTPGSYIIGQEEDSVCVSWHYGSSSCSYDFQNSQASQVLLSLWNGALSNGTADVVISDNAIEIRPLKTNAVFLVDKLLSFWGGKNKFDFIMVLGKFGQRDEDIYRYISGNLKDLSRRSSYSSIEELESIFEGRWMCTVDRHLSYADYYASDPKALISFLAL